MFPDKEHDKWSWKPEDGYLQKEYHHSTRTTSFLFNSTAPFETKSAFTKLVYCLPIANHQLGEKWRTDHAAGLRMERRQNSKDPASVPLTLTHELRQLKLT